MRAGRTHAPASSGSRRTSGSGSLAPTSSRGSARHLSRQSATERKRRRDRCATAVAVHRVSTVGSAHPALVLHRHRASDGQSTDQQERGKDRLSVGAGDGGAGRPRGAAKRRRLCVSRPAAPVGQNRPAILRARLRGRSRICAGLGRASARAADLSGARMHDLRHTFASMGAAGGLSLQLIGGLLGHAAIRTTERYSHFVDSRPARRGGADRRRPRAGDRCAAVEREGMNSVRKLSM